MPFNKIEITLIEEAISHFMDKRRPPIQIRDKVDFGSRIEGLSVMLFEIRPMWNDQSKYTESPFAKATFVKSRSHWKIFWQRADLKWHKYDPKPIVRTIDEFLIEVAEDNHGCFFG